MTRLLSWMKRRKGLFLVLILAVLLAGGLFLPRRLSRLCLESSVESLTSVEVYCPPNGGEGEFEEYHITQPEETEDILVINNRQYVLYSRDFAEQLRRLLKE